MVRGTTAAFKFNLPYELQYIAEARVVFWQEGYKGTLSNSLPIRKTYPGDSGFKVDPTSKELVVVLTEADTRAFTDKLKARVQMKAVYVLPDETKGTFASRPQLFTVYPIDDEIMDGVIGEDTTVAQGGYIILDGQELPPITEVGDS